MKCFVIMPYSDDFDDVHMAIEAGVNAVREPSPVQCTRLDDDQRGGRIIVRLEQELRECDMCVADLSGNRCNVMWEVGYAMALGKPVILISQGEINLHFDLHDVQHIKYQRTQLRRSLTEPLTTAITHTARNLATVRPTEDAPIAPDRIEESHARIDKLTDMVQQLVHHFLPPQKFDRLVRCYELIPPSEQYAHLAGAWFNSESGSCIYVRFINKELVAPYCFAGNESLTGVYHSLQNVGDLLHARFEWIHTPISGFALLREDPNGSLTGAWWMDEDCDMGQDGMPPLESGAQAVWTRMKGAQTPKWANDFFRLVEADGMNTAIARLRAL